MKGFLIEMIALCRYKTTEEEDAAVIADSSAKPRKRVAARLVRIEKSILKCALLHAPCPCSRLVQPPFASLHWMGCLRPARCKPPGGGRRICAAMYLCFYSAQLVYPVINRFLKP